MSIKILFANVIDKKNFSSLTGNSIVSFSILFNFSGIKLSCLVKSLLLDLSALVVE